MAQVNEGAQFEQPNWQVRQVINVAGDYIGSDVGAAKTRPPVSKELANLADRRPQIIDLEASMDANWGRTSKPASVILLPGPKREFHSGLVSRFCHLTFPRIARLHRQESPVVTQHAMRWPCGASLEDDIERLGTELRAIFNLPASAHGTELKHKLANVSGHHVLRYNVRGSTWRKFDGNLIEDWCGFWDKVTVAGQNDSITVFICLIAETRPSGWLSFFKPDPSKSMLEFNTKLSVAGIANLYKLSALQPLAQADLIEWATTEIPASAPECAALLDRGQLEIWATETDLFDGAEDGKRPMNELREPMLKALEECWD